VVEPVRLNAAENDPERSEEVGSSKPSASGEGGSHRRGKAKKKRSFWKELPILIVVALVLTILIQQFVAKVYMIPSGSMEATLHGCTGCTGDRILVDRVTYDFTDPRPGDVVVFKGPEAWTTHEVTPQDTSNILVKGLRGFGSLIGFAPPDERDFVKRVIATPGQTVQCCDAQNRVIVDGKALDEPYIHWEPGSPQRQVDFAPVRVPAGKLWVMGDNRNNSSDSRFQGTGGADRSHASRKIKTWKTETHLTEDHITHGIKHVVMHADKARNHAVAVQVEHLRFTRYTYRRGISDSRDFSFEYHDGLVLARSCAGAINDAYMSQSHNRSIYFYKIAHLRRQSLCHHQGADR